VVNGNFKKKSNIVSHLTARSSDIAERPCDASCCWVFSL